MKLSKMIPAVSGMALAAFASAAAHGQAGTGSAKVVLSVNDTNPVGTAGDALLSLDEAIRLANGTLALGGLSAGERAQVRGAPGARSRDLITLPAGANLTVAKGAAVSQLVGNDGDTLDGQGATLTSAETGKGVGLIISSSNFVLRNFQGRGFATAVRVEFGGRKLANVTLEKLSLFGAVLQSALLEIGATASNGTLRGVSLSDSVLDTEGLPGYASLAHIAASKALPGGTVDNVLLEDVRFVRNRINGGGLGLYLTGSLGSGFTTNAVTRGVVVADNTFINQHDSALNLVGALPAMGGRHTKVGLENVVATGNRVETSNYGFYMGNEMFGAARQPGTMTDSFFRNITISRNIVTRGAMGWRGYCIILENGADFRRDEALRNVMENIKITDNDISGCVDSADRQGAPRLNQGAGVIVYAGRASMFGPDSSGGTARDNAARNIQIANNRITGSDRGIVLVGGFTLERGTTEQPTVVTGNSLTGVRIAANRLENNATGIRVVGGDGPAGTNVAGNSVSGVTIQGNQIAGSKIVCETIANAGGATGNTVNVTCPAAAR